MRTNCEQTTRQQIPASIPACTTIAGTTIPATILGSFVSYICPAVIPARPLQTVWECQTTRERDIEEDENEVKTKSKAAIELASRLFPCHSERSFDSWTGTWTRTSDGYSGDDDLKRIYWQGTWLTTPKPIADLREIQAMYHGWTKTKFETLINRIKKQLFKPSNHNYIHKAEHDRIIAKYEADVAELNENFEEIFKHDFPNENDNCKTDFKEEIKEEYLEEIAHNLISDYQLLLDAEDLLKIRMKEQQKAFCDGYDRFKKAFKATLTAEQIELNEIEGEPLFTDDEDF